MSRSFSIVPGRVLGLRDGTSFFDTDAYPVQYANSGLTVSGYTLSFPDFRKGNAYCWQQWDSTGSGGNPRESAISLITMAGQEWGPASSNPTDAGTQIDDVVLGMVPDTADHILVRAKATRTTTPSQINGNTIPVEPEPGQWTIAYGGTLLIEQLYPIARMIHVYLAATANGDGTRNVMLSRLQSVVRKRQGFYRTGNDYSKTGWTYGGTYGSVYGIPVAQRDTKAANTDATGVGGRYKRTGSSPAATSDNTDYSSAYTLDLEITPGRSNITPTSGAGSNAAYFGFVDETVDEVAGATHTAAVQFGPADATRNVIVALSGKGPTGRAITGVTIGGVTATVVASRATNFASTSETYYSAIYIAAVPTGTSGNVAVTWNGSVAMTSVSVFAGYNMNSTSPDATISSGSANAATSLATVAGGFAVAVGTKRGNFANVDYYQVPYSDLWIGGMSNPSLQPGTPSNGAGQPWARNFDLTTGASLSLTFNNIGSTAEGPAWVAASFH